ncbi:MAG: hypothetical protein ACLQHK_06645 [Gallionellaceae bacterium]
MGTLEQRITALEQKTMDVHRKAVRIVCKGDTPTADEQQQIDEAQAKGYFVIVRLFVSPPKHILD